MKCCGSSLETQRQRDARMAEIYARVVWFALHGLIVLIIVLPDTVLKQDLRDRNYRQLIPFFGVMVITLIFYVAVGVTNPGYLYPDSQGKRSITWNQQQIDQRVNSNLTNGSVRERKQSSPQGSQILEYAQDTSEGHEENGINAHLTAGIRSSQASNSTDVEHGDNTDGQSTQSNGNQHGKHCQYCGAWQPLRTKHCHDCNKCVRKFDHHCAFVGNCVGAGNHVLFWWYLLWQLIEILWGLLIVVRSLDDRPERKMASFYLPLIFGALILMFFLLFVGAIFCYHTFLIFTNTTTYERERWKKISYLQGVPEGVPIFSKGVFCNIWMFCCRPSFEYTMPNNLNEIIEEQNRETIWNNRYYSCF
eukprot:TRINITY_DN17633_c1_g1_i2.p1 TRINITY_DN17633_c1_g1~~TRINITY_DN17633_c1_g1_i2.p1  ORF type:complete len:362 (-),score=12.71 TRINITY_DN17633_c1_g1_i2:629-1714(-)